jgi:lysophospholipid acyltransferase (LPLAT)-like uncharacterized protein
MNELLHNNSPAFWLLPLLARLYLRLLGLTSRVTVKGQKDYPGPAAYALWHRQEALMFWLHRGSGLTGMVSKSKDGEYLARILLPLGFNFLRGSSSSGGVMALRGLIKAARNGYSIGITPDGPKGPIFKAQAGVVLIAQKGGIPIIPAACALSRKLVLRSWDKYQFPLPFGRVEAVYGAPITVSETDDIAAKTLELETALNALTEEAERLLAAGA